MVRTKTLLSLNPSMNSLKVMSLLLALLPNAYEDEFPARSTEGDEATHLIYYLNCQDVIIRHGMLLSWLYHYLIP